MPGSRGRVLRRTALVAVLLALDGLLLLAGGTVNVIGRGNYPSEPSDRGTALVTGCARIGPVSTYGLGWWWMCRARVLERDRPGSAPAVIRFEAGEVSPNDIGSPVDFVRRTNVSTRPPGSASVRFYRADPPPHRVATQMLALAMSLSALIAPAAVLIWYVRRATRRRNGQRSGPAGSS